MKTQWGAKQQQNVSREWESGRGEKEQKSKLTKRARAVTVCVCVCVCCAHMYLHWKRWHWTSQRERERDEEEMVIGVSSVADSFLFYTKSSSKFELILSFCILILELTSSRRTTSSWRRLWNSSHSSLYFSISSLVWRIFFLSTSKSVPCGMLVVMFVLVGFVVAVLVGVLVW